MTLAQQLTALEETIDSANTFFAACSFIQLTRNPNTGKFNLELCLNASQEWGDAVHDAIKEMEETSIALHNLINQQ